MQISPKCCIVSASLSAAAFALKCKAAQFYVSTRKHLQKQRPKAATYLCRFAAKARFDNRLTQGVRFPKGRGRNPSLFGRFKERGFLRGEGNRNPSPLKWRFWLLLSLLTKVTRRRQNRKSKSLSPQTVLWVLSFGKESTPSVSINSFCHSEEHPRGTCFAARSDVGIRNLLTANLHENA